MLIELPQFRSRDGLRLHQNAAPRVPADVAVERILRDAVVRSDLDEREVGATLEHPSRYDIVQLQPSEIDRIQQLRGCHSRGFEAIAQHANRTLDESLH